MSHTQNEFLLWCCTPSTVILSSYYWKIYHWKNNLLLETTPSSSILDTNLYDCVFDLVFFWESKMNTCIIWKRKELTNRCLTQYHSHWDKLVSLLQTTHFMYKIIISCWRKMMAFVSRLLKSLTQSYCKYWFVIGDDWSTTHQEVGCLSLIFLHVPLLIVLEIISPLLEQTILGE